MSFPTVSTFLHKGDWNQESRKHPAMEWMETYTRHCIDSKDWSSGAFSKFHTPNWTCAFADGRVLSGPEAWTAIAELYDKFAAHKHEPYWLNCYETPGSKGGYTMDGMAGVFVDLPGQGKQAGNGAKDNEGREWDLRIPGAFHFDYVKEGSGFKLARTEIYSDSGPAMTMFLQRGLIKPADLGL